jgi:hypothetical protein
VKTINGHICNKYIHGTGSYLIYTYKVHRLDVYSISHILKRKYCKVRKQYWVSGISIMEFTIKKEISVMGILRNPHTGGHPLIFS